METLFWISAAWVVYVYAGYPLLASLLAAIAGRPAARGGAASGIGVAGQVTHHLTHDAAVIELRLAQVLLPSLCPHGRPVVVKIDRAMIDKSLSRN